MAGTINSLGIGSGVLTADVIDQLKENDKSLQITPIDTQLALLKQKTTAAELLDTLVTTFKSSLYSLQDSSIFQNRNVSTTGSAATVTANAGVNEQSFSLNVTNLAQNNVLESGSFFTRDGMAAATGGTLSLSVGGVNYDVVYSGGDTLEELAQAINDEAGEAVTASILQVGESDYRLVLSSTETGADQLISLSDTGGLLPQLLQPQQHILQSGAFTSAADTIALAPGDSGTITLNINGTDYNFLYDDTTTLQQLVDDINTNAGTEISATITADFRLELTSVGTGEDNRITMSNTGNLNDALVSQIATTQDPAGGMETIQEPEDATFTFNGISVTRASNTVDDLLVGVTITLQEENSSNVTISQNKDDIASALETVVENYNNLMRELGNMTNADPENEKVGVFNGDSSVRGIGRDITRLLTSFDSGGRSLIDYGIGLNEDGTMTFNSSEFTAKMAVNPSETEAFFSGGTFENENGDQVTLNGLFDSVYEKVSSFLGTQGVVSQLKEGIDHHLTTLQEERTRTLTLLEARYEAMTARFIQYDAIISRINNQFSSLQQQIQLAINGNDN